MLTLPDKFLVQLAINAGRKRLSRQTGFVHHCYENPAAHTETIPFFENAAFAYALLQSRLSEQMLEGIALLERLLKFEVEGEFPVYLHEYPLCRHPYFFTQLKPIFQGVLRGFAQVLSKELRATIRRILEQEREVAPLKPSTSPAVLAAQLLRHHVETPEEYLEKLEEAEKLWHPTLKLYLGPQRQERREPEVTLLDLLMGQRYGAYSTRAVQDHPVHLLAALVPQQKPVEILSSATHCKTSQGLFWGDGESLVSFEMWENGVATLPELLPGERDSGIELSFYCNQRAERQILVDEKKSTTFQLGQKIEIISADQRVTLIFSLEEGEGQFFGHIVHGNRPNQIGASKFEAYDWRIALRTISRTSACKIRVVLKTASAALSWDLLDE